MLTLARGDTLDCRVKLRKTDGKVLRPEDGMTVSVGAWGPGSDRAGDPDHRVLCGGWDGRSWSAELPTGGWEPGTWFLCALAEGMTLKGTSRREIVIS